ncbi:hypothetical protein Salat_2785200 [Sesamum alatum]|uniref:Uncharacterized protein n=1 Tax=Sesamum alatum TaxID=300844 RepID=A0AAE1XL48_9LAMI|nr:hypothetical protein Salat_2785200 [Sesamum alatum]
MEMQTDRIARAAKHLEVYHCCLAKARAEQSSGKVLFELYRACLLPCDMRVLSDLHHARLDIMGAPCGELALVCGELVLVREQLSNDAERVNSIEHENARLLSEISIAEAELRNLESRHTVVKATSCSVAETPKGNQGGLDTTKLSFFHDSKCKKYKKFRLVDLDSKEDEFADLAGLSKSASLEDGDIESSSNLDNIDNEADSQGVSLANRSKVAKD